MAKKQERLIRAKHNKRGDFQIFPESHWRLVDKTKWTEVPDKERNTPLPEVEAEIKERKKREPKNESL